MESLGVGIVGCGAIGSRRAGIVGPGSRTRVVAVADAQAVRAERVAGTTGATVMKAWEDVVSHAEVDIVVVATTPDWLAPVTIEALGNGKHVLCEKPMGRNSREAEAVVAASRRSGRLVHAGFNHRFHPAIRRARAMAAAGEIGDLLFVRCRYGHGGRPGYEREWRMAPEVSGGGELLDQGIHAIDLVRWFLGDPSEVMGLTATLAWSAPVEDNAFVLFRTPRGQVASLHASWTQWKNLFSFEVVGHAGALVVEGLGGSYGTETLTVLRRRTGPPEEARWEYPAPDESWAAEWNSVVAAIRSGARPSTGADDGLAALRIVEAVYEASRSGIIVRLDSRLIQVAAP